MNNWDFYYALLAGCRLSCSYLAQDLGIFGHCCPVFMALSYLFIFVLVVSTYLPFRSPAFDSLMLSVLANWCLSLSSESAREPSSSVRPLDVCRFISSFSSLLSSLWRKRFCFRRERVFSTTVSFLAAVILKELLHHPPSYTYHYPHCPTHHAACVISAVAAGSTPPYQSSSFSPPPHHHHSYSVSIFSFFLPPLFPFTRTGPVVVSPSSLKKSPVLRSVSLDMRKLGSTSLSTLLSTFFFSFFFLVAVTAVHCVYCSTAAC